MSHERSDETTSEPTRIECDGCPGRGLACDDCVVAVLFGGPPREQPAVPPHRASEVGTGARVVPLHAKNKPDTISYSA